MNATMTVAALGIAPVAAALAQPVPATVSDEAAEGASRIVTTFAHPVPIDPLCPGGSYAGGGVAGPAERGGGPVAEPIVTDAAPEGDMPIDLEYTADGLEVAVVHRDTDNVVFFDAATRAILATVAVGDYPLDVAASPDNQYVIVPNALTHTVSVIDRATHTVAATIPITGMQPYRVQVTADSRFAVVGVINDAVNSALSIIDLDTLTEARVIPTASQGVMGFFFSPENGIAGELLTQFDVAPDSVRVVLPNRAAQSVHIYDILTGVEAEPILTGFNLPTSVDISGDGTLAIVGHEGNNRRITKIDLAGGFFAGTVTTLADLSDQVIRITPDNSHAMAAISNNVIFVDLTTGVESARLATGVVGDIEISHDGQFAFVSNFNARIINIASRTIVATVSFAPCVPATTSPVALQAAAINNASGRTCTSTASTGPRRRWRAGRAPGRRLSRTRCATWRSAPTGSHWWARTTPPPTPSSSTCRRERSGRTSTRAIGRWPRR
jgi:YVTN family beta-propeller protein